MILFEQITTLYDHDKGAVYDMKHIVIGTNRSGSNSGKVARFIHNLYAERGEQVGMIDLEQLDWSHLDKPYGKTLPPVLRAAVEQVDSSDGLIMVVPEYNGSYPGVLKYFIDHWTYPTSFESRPVCFVGLGYRWGGLRPVEHLQGVFGYRNAYVFPERVFITNIGDVIRDGTVKDAAVVELLGKQADGFRKFVSALDQAGLHARNLNNQNP
jgi:NAD(P)H-dependent FMN reductase